LNLSITFINGFIIQTNIYFNFYKFTVSWICKLNESWLDWWYISIYVAKCYVKICKFFRYKVKAWYHTSLSCNGYISNNWISGPPGLLTLGQLSPASYPPNSCPPRTLIPRTYLPDSYPPPRTFTLGHLPPPPPPRTRTVTPGPLLPWQLPLDTCLHMGKQ
jgi:hypothetical protein